MDKLNALYQGRGATAHVLPLRMFYRTVAPAGVYRGTGPSRGTRRRGPVKVPRDLFRWAGLSAGKRFSLQGGGSIAGRIINGFTLLNRHELGGLLRRVKISAVESDGSLLDRIEVLDGGAGPYLTRTARRPWSRRRPWTPPPPAGKSRGPGGVPMALK
jgi:hypothetical protein